LRSSIVAPPPAHHEAHSMKNLAALLGQLAGMFVEDGALALAIIGVVVLAGLVAVLVPAESWLSGIILLLGCLGVLVTNVARAKRP
jgi:energy-coupling factor transporter transmembrane protein EcfT